MGCGAEPSALTAEEFFAQQTALECDLLSTCDPEDFSQRFDDEEDCLESLNQGEFCTIEDDEQAALCLTITESITCDDLEPSGGLPSLANCTAAIECGQLN